MFEAPATAYDAPYENNQESYESDDGLTFAGRLARSLNATGGEPAPSRTRAAPPAARQGATPVVTPAPNGQDPSLAAGASLAPTPLEAVTGPSRPDAAASNPTMQAGAATGAGSPPDAGRLGWTPRGMGSTAIIFIIALVAAVAAAAAAAKILLPLPRPTLKCVNEICPPVLLDGLLTLHQPELSIRAEATYGAPFFSHALTIDQESARDV